MTADIWLVEDHTRTRYIAIPNDNQTHFDAGLSIAHHVITAPIGRGARPPSRDLALTLTGMGSAFETA